MAMLAGDVPPLDVLFFFFFSRGIKLNFKGQSLLKHNEAEKIVLHTI